MENSAKRRRKEVTWGTSASSNAQFLLRSVCVGNREDGRFLVKIINNMCSVILFFRILFSRVWKKKTKYYPSKMFPVSAFPIPGYGKFSKNTYFFSGAKVFNELPVNVASVNNIQAFCGLAKHLLL